jgi:hypothetical protein
MVELYLCSLTCLQSIVLNSLGTGITLPCLTSVLASSCSRLCLNLFHHSEAIVSHMNGPGLKAAKFKA